MTRALSRISISYSRDRERVFIDSFSLENLNALDGSTSGQDSISFYCRFRLLPERRSLFQTKIVRLTRLQSNCLFDAEQLNEFDLSFDQLNNHAIEILLYRSGTLKPLYKDVRLATVKYDLHELSESDRVHMRTFFDECDPPSSVQVT